MVEPIKPGEIQEVKNSSIPDKVLEVFNQLITDNWNGRSSTFKQEEVVEILVDQHEFDKSEIFDKHWLDVEPLFRSQGWIVEYDKPGYCETYAATFTFRKE